MMQKTTNNDKPVEASKVVESADQIVLVLDDDSSVLRGLERLLKVYGYRVHLFTESADFFKAGMPQVPACLILDNQLTDGVTGLQVHKEMRLRGWHIPTLFLTAHWDSRSIVTAIQAGADDFLTKPFKPAELVQAVAKALQRAREIKEDGYLAVDARYKAESLTEREREIVRLVVSGLINKEIADKLNLALVTVKVHRGRAMHKLGAGNPAELARVAALAGLLR